MDESSRNPYFLPAITPYKFHAKRSTDSGFYVEEPSEEYKGVVFARNDQKGSRQNESRPTLSKHNGGSSSHQTILTLKFPPKTPKKEIRGPNCIKWISICLPDIPIHIHCPHFLNPNHIVFSELQHRLLHHLRLHRSDLSLNNPHLHKELTSRKHFHRKAQEMCLFRVID
ncbi:hypothetical protein QVD17_39538 [Tagetes erecta]|uniref:Uncharacterized protein n=1 Tax=Tagetes erecta TaxID=13708 RepID=A0AAD8NH83_TARER|nr:hypothetical protein QVD17_39538 [Tagetes erecta]